MVPIDLPVDETVAFVLAHLSRPDMRILDVGCGNGLVANHLQAHGHSIVAIDESPEKVQAANALGVAARVAAWPSFEDAPFDAILFAASLHHIHPLAEAVEQAHRLLVPSGLVIVEDFAWDGIDRITAEWFYGIVRLLASCQAVSMEGDRFVAELASSGGEFTCWQESHDHELHTITTMWSTLQTRFHELSETRVPYLYRYLCPVLPENDIGYRIVSQVLELEGRLANLGTISLIGHRFIGRKR
jgi:SAM-dependent methyltransferase